MGWGTGGQQGRTPVTTGTLVVPVYMEAETIAEALTQIAGYLGGRPGDVVWDLVVVDDGSTDGSGDIVEGLAGALPVPLTLVRHRENQRLGGALRTGFAHTTGDLVAVLDADLTYCLEHLDRMVAAWLPTRAHVVVASPYCPGGNSVAVPSMSGRRSRVANRLLAAAMGPDGVSTLTGMVRVYDGPFIRGLPIKAVGPDVNVEIIYKAMALRCRVVEVPATLDWSGRESRAGRSAMLSRASRWTTLKSLLMTFLFKPYLVPVALTVLGFLVAVAGALAGGLDAHAVFTLGAVLMVCSGFFSVAMLQAKRYFEETFTAVTAVSGTRPMPPVTAVSGTRPMPPVTVTRHPAGQREPEAPSLVDVSDPVRSVQINAASTESNG